MDGVREPVEEKVGGQECHAEEHVLLLLAGARRPRFLRVRGVEREDCYACRHRQNHKVLVERVFAPEERNVQEHHWEEFAGFGEDVGDVVDMLEGGVTERGGEGLRDRDCEELQGDADAGEDAGCGAGGIARGVAKVEVAGEGGEEGLDGVQHQGRAEDLLVGAVRCRRDAFLEECPGEEGRVYTAHADYKLEDAGAVVGGRFDLMGEGLGGVGDEVVGGGEARGVGLFSAGHCEGRVRND